ncbi:MAG: exodeoxyribonuclease III [Solirubrobacteraceae bacterium]
MKLVTWNVNSLNARLPRVLEFLQDQAPDVVCLQETKVDAAAFPADELQAAGYRAHHHSGGRWAGVAILARDGVELEGGACGLPGERAPDEARWCEALAGGLRVASTYVTNGREVDTQFFDEKLAFLDAIAARADDLDVILGDFNVAPADIDVYDPEAFAGSTHVTEDERLRLRAILDRGFVDASAHLHPGEQRFTWWDYRQGHFHRGMGLRIDLALVRESLLPRLRECAIVRDYRKGTKPSDHAPLVLELA